MSIPSIGHLAIAVTKDGKPHPTTGKVALRRGPFKHQQDAIDWLRATTNLDNRWVEHTVETHLYHPTQLV